MGDRRSIGNQQLYWTPRALAILKGSSNRSVTSNFWVNRAFQVIEAELNEDPNKLIVVTDVRYKSELEQFEDRFEEKVIFIRVKRFHSSPSNDPSERDLDDHNFDYYIDNTKTESDSYRQLREALFHKFKL
jgi:hypothetical protein